MKIYALYFSPTGGTKRVLELLISAWDCEKEYIDLSEYNVDGQKISFCSDDICVVAVPSFSGRVPQFILPKLKSIEGNGTKAMMIAAYGNRAFDDTLLELKDTLESVGFRCICAAAAVTQHSVLPVYGKGRPDASDLEELKDFSRQCKEAMETKDENVIVSGNRPYREYISVPIYPKGDRTCVQCGLCYQKCPVNAILEDDYRRCDKSRCISCLKCISVCPKKARRVNPLVLKIAEMKLRSFCEKRKENQLFLP